MKKTLSIMAVLALAAGFAQAATVTWDGDTDAELGTAANWSDNTAPSGANP